MPPVPLPRERIAEDRLPPLDARNELLPPPLNERTELPLPPPPLNDRDDPPLDERMELPPLNDRDDPPPLNDRELPPPPLKDREEPPPLNDLDEPPPPPPPPPRPPLPPPPRSAMTIPAVVNIARIATNRGFRKEVWNRIFCPASSAGGSIRRGRALRGVSRRIIPRLLFIVNFIAAMRLCIRVVGDSLPIESIRIARICTADQFCAYVKPTQCELTMPSAYRVELCPRANRLHK